MPRAAGWLRYVPKKRHDGRWGVYDRLLGSWPLRRPRPVGRVRQYHPTPAAAGAEASRLESAEETRPDPLRL